MRRAATSIAAVTLVLLPACGGSGDPSSAEACASVVRQVRSAPDQVEVTATVETAEGQVEIRYAYVDAENAPVSGAASCTFAVGGPGSLQLVEAIVDGELVEATALSAANRVLSERGP